MMEHPNWKALSTVDFQRKIFVRPTTKSDAKDASTQPSENKSSEKDTGDNVRQFYDSLIATTSEATRAEDAAASSSARRSTASVTTSTARLKKAAPKKSYLDTALVLPKAFHAAQYNDINVLREILAGVRHDRDVAEARDSYGWTLLMVAACGNATDVVEFLLQRQDVQLDARDRTGLTAEDLARKCGRKAMADRLARAASGGTSTTLTNRESRRDDRSRGHTTSVSGESRNNGRIETRECDVCKVTFETSSEWRRHVSSVLHQMKRSQAELEAGNLRPHFGISEANRGYQMLMSVGWDKKSGLGPRGDGKLFPVKTVLKRGRTGLGLEAETSGTRPVAKVTHFDAGDACAVADVVRTERPATMSRRQQKKELAKDKVKEVNFRREFSSL